MAFVLKDRVRETSDTNGTGAIRVTGVVTGGYQTFTSVLSNGDTTLCLCRNSAGQWQTFLGTWVSATSSLTRTTAYEGSSGAGVNVNFSGESQEVWIDYPARSFQNPSFQTLQVGTFAATQSPIVSVTGNVFGNSSTAVPAFKSVWNLAGAYTGAGTNGIHLHEFTSNNSNYGVGTAGTFINTYVSSSLSGSLATGSHVAFQAEIDQTGATPNLGAYVIAAVMQGTANSNAGGILGTEHGNVFGFNSIAQVKTGATYFTSVVGAEIDYVAKEVVLDKIGLQIVPWVGDTYAGTRSDAMLVFVRNPSGLIGATNGIVFGAPYGWWPMASTGTMIGAPYDTTASISAGSPSKAAAWGIDFSTVAFSGGFLKSTGFTVDGSGNATVAKIITATQTPASAAATGTAGTIAWDASYVYVCTATNTWKRTAIATW